MNNLEPQINAKRQSVAALKTLANIRAALRQLQVERKRGERRQRRLRFGARATAEVDAIDERRRRARERRRERRAADCRRRCDGGRGDHLGAGFRFCRC